MKVKYLGDKKEFRAHGYHFNHRNDYTVDVPDYDGAAQKKFIGNRYFHADHDDNSVAPRLYVREIISIPVGGRKPPVIRKRNVNVFAANTRKECEDWVAAWGGRVYEGDGMPRQGEGRFTHYIVKNTEKIEPADDGTGAANGPALVGIFRMKNDGTPRAKPDKTFEGEDAEQQAREYMEDNDIDPDSRLLMSP